MGWPKAGEPQASPKTFYLIYLSMLPDDLLGPDVGIAYVDAGVLDEFVAQAAKRHPNLHRDFVVQICFEEHSHFDGCLPAFDVESNKIVVRRVTASWIKNNVRQYDNESLETESFYGSEIEEFLSTNTDPGFVREMLTAKTWPFLPLIVGYKHAVQNLGGEPSLGRPYHLIEGCHRISYLLKMLELGVVTANSQHQILEVI